MGCRAQKMRQEGIKKKREEEGKRGEEEEDDRGRERGGRGGGRGNEGVKRSEMTDIRFDPKRRSEFV